MKLPAEISARLGDFKRRGEKIACLTCYDASFAHALAAAGVDLLLVGDSLGMVMQGHDSTLPVSMTDMIYHASCVARGAPDSLRIVDLPYQSYESLEQALDNAKRLLSEGEGHIVKPEGGGRRIEIVRGLVDNGIPVCGHLGLLPQSVKELGGYKVQGRDDASAKQIADDALALEAAGVSLLVLEAVPVSLAKKISQSLVIPTIGIGAGPDTDGQVLVLQDLLGITPGHVPKFAKNFMVEAGTVDAAVRVYVDAVKEGTFPADEHVFK